MSLNIPFLMMMVLTMMVWIMLYIRRLSWMSREKIDPQQLATRQDKSIIPPHIEQAADNFQNLLELPVIFYALCLYMAWGNEVGVWDIYLAYIFVASRYVHSLIQCTYNRVVHRFLVYVVGALAIWVMLLRVVWGVLF